MTESTNALRKKSLFFLKEALIIAVIIALAFPASRLVHTWLGKQALEKVQLDNLSYQVAVEKAQHEDKPLMLEFSAIWCSSCRKLNKQVLANTRVSEKIRSDYVYARLDYDAPLDRKLFDQYGIQGFPTILVMNPDKTNIRALPTTFDPDQFLRLL